MKRAAFMDASRPCGQGGMAAVMGLLRQEIGQVLADIPDLWVANLNGASQIVVSGKPSIHSNRNPPAQGKGAKRVVSLNVLRGVPLSIHGHGTEIAGRPSEEHRPRGTVLPCRTNAPPHGPSGTPRDQDLPCRAACETGPYSRSRFSPRGAGRQSFHRNRAPLRAGTAHQAWHPG